MLTILVCPCITFCIFFFKQKTAYEMRISDWSSDVCSSDLCFSRSPPTAAARCGRWHRAEPCRTCRYRKAHPAPLGGLPRTRLPAPACRGSVPGFAHRRNSRSSVKKERSEEHTSELQSLMRISYAVFCLKKKNTINKQ